MFLQLAMLIFSIALSQDDLEGEMALYTRKRVSTRIDLESPFSNSTSCRSAALRASLARAVRSAHRAREISYVNHFENLSPVNEVDRA